MNTSSPYIPPPKCIEPTVAFSVDVEDYFMSPESIPFEDWKHYPSAIHEGMQNCLALLKEFNAKATFFYVGWLAERYPEIVKWAVDAGHEIGTHTYTHKFIHEMDEPEFDASIKKSLEVIQAAAPNSQIAGHRAPAFSLDRNKPWQFEVLQKYGITYDSSITPHSTYLYGDHAAPRFPYYLHNMLEIPPSVIDVFGKRFPVGGGGTLRILPDWYLRWVRKRFLREGYPLVIYMHPWEFVPNHPPLRLPFKQQRIHYTGLKSVSHKLRRLFSDYKSITMREYVNLLQKD
jgi:polysaccharide deacetylase family protein (PEP-CTERM system associated)